jgi:23S rRNA pseudouridine1911/1915/1917 synthase
LKVQSVRLDKYILERYSDFSRSRIEGLVKAGFVKVNGVAAAKAGMKISEGDEVCVEIPPPVPSEIVPEDIPLDVVFEDDDIIVINKKAGLVVHPAPGHHSGTLVNALLHHCPDLSGIGSVARPGLVHRLDQDTSGVMVVAKSQRAMDMLVKDFATHTNLKKTYLAISHPAPSGSKGFLQQSGRVETLIGRHPVDRKKMAIVDKNGKNAITNWSILNRADAPAKRVVAICCDIETGRTHQIRVHLASLGMPIVGDKVYGKSQLDNRLELKVDRQMLHAWKLRLRHPVTRQDMEFTAPIPEDMRWACGL